MKEAIQIFGKDLPVFGKDLWLQISVAILSNPVYLGLSCAIDVQLIENMKEQEAKLIIHTREFIRENMTTFTGTIIRNETPTLCVGYCRHSPAECWIIET